MNLNKKKIFWLDIIFFVVLLLVGGYFFYKSAPPATAPEDDGGVVTSTGKVDVSTGTVSTSLPEGVTVEDLSDVER
ncbi:MAG: hypothetical protein AUJ23_01250 [Candidatus Magasanikbacteria bacterium CG1_02_32_51]|uniref:Uncharacterized protein n=1 Tax=Candidatus Magasanikbacteria bacterium CG1_02_32_51 TaxID=1805238 RepID=A0A1J4U9F6_9BACT|nr:MAG: hypothetical protein AUJ23_01250 [Candidatus Magasanikbacteria bacterium CG1_02_32_51]